MDVRHCAKIHMDSILYSVPHRVLFPRSIISTCGKAHNCISGVDRAVNYGQAGSLSNVMGYDQMQWLKLFSHGEYCNDVCIYYGIILCPKFGLASCLDMIISTRNKPAFNRLSV
jgi:hypothetical protein